MPPLASAVATGAATAATLIALGVVAVVSVERIMERAAVQQATSVATAMSLQLNTRTILAADAAIRRHAAADTAVSHELDRVLVALAAALPEAQVHEIAAVHGDSMTIVASYAQAGNPDVGPALLRGGRTIPVASDVRSAWNADSAAAVARIMATPRLGGIRVWVPIRDPGSRRVIAALGSLTPEAYDGRTGPDIRGTIFAGVAVIAALALITALGRYRAEQSRAASDAQLVAAKEAAEAVARSRGEFLANMSHEIRTPLHGVLGMTEALLATPHTEADRRSLEVIGQSATSLLGILNDILDYSKLEAGRIELVDAPFDPRALVDDVADLFAVRAEEKSLDLATHEVARTDRLPAGDAARIRQVLLNLVGNAVKFTERGAIQIEVASVAIGRTTIALRFAVRDTGIGIAPEAQESVFEQFAQAEASTSRRFGGTGLGLTISRQLVHLMGGRIGVNSARGEGSEFTVDLQLPATTAPAPPVARPRLPFGDRVLVCTGMPATRAALVEMCAHARLIGVPCATTDEAAALLASDSGFGLVICDAPQDAKAPHPLHAFAPPLVMLTTVRHPLNNSTLSALGATAQLRRPIRQDHFSALIQGAATSTLGVQGKGKAPGSRQETAASSAGAAPGTLPATAPPPASAARPHDRPRVLVVDDVELNLLVAKAMFASLNIAVRTASGGRQAVEMLSEEPMDLVLMDCHMPELDGYEATRMVRAAAGPNRRTPIIALSASAFADDRERAMQSGMNDFAAKPIELEALRTVLQRWTMQAAGT